MVGFFLFTLYFAYFQKNEPQKPSKMDITKWLWNFFLTWSQNGPISVKWKHQSQLISHKHITFNTLFCKPPCSSWNLQRAILFRVTWYICRNWWRIRFFFHMTVTINNNPMLYKAKFVSMFWFSNSYTPLPLHTN